MRDQPVFFYERKTLVYRIAAHPRTIQRRVFKENIQNSGTMLIMVTHVIFSRPAFVHSLVDFPKGGELRKEFLT